jgi:hypothetical protein
VVWEAVCGGEAVRMAVMWRVEMVRLTCELVISNLGDFRSHLLPTEECRASVPAIS